MGGMAAYFEGRVGPGWEVLGARTSDEDYSEVLSNLKHPHTDYFKMFYADTALFGGRAGTVCGLDYYGADHVVFASDMAFEPSTCEAPLKFWTVSIFPKMIGLRFITATQREYSDYRLGL